MRVSIISAIFRKEMLDMVRDRRTMISMVAVPLLVIPLLLFIMNAVIMRMDKKSEEEARSMGVALRVTMRGVRESLEQTGLQIIVRDDLRGAVEKKEAAAAVEETTGPKGVPDIQVYVDRSSPTSNAAAETIRTALNDLKDRKVKEGLRKSGIPDTLLTPFTITRTNIAGERKMAGAVWGSMLGYVLLLLMFTGGMYPIIDMTAGEKERKTLEAFLASPAGRREIVLGKTLAGMTAIFLTAMLTLSSMVFSLRNQKVSARSDEFKQVLRSIPLDTHTLMLIVVTLLPLAVFAASVMIAIALLARSFKEGQSYLTPLAMVVIFPALLGGLPGLEMSPALCLIPIFNASQIIRGIMLGEFSTVNFSVTLAANLVYAALAFFIASRTFEDEKVLFRS